MKTEEVSVDQVGSKDSDAPHACTRPACAFVSVDQVGSKDSDGDATSDTNTTRMCPLIRLVPRTATAVSYEACVYWV